MLIPPVYNSIEFVGVTIKYYGIIIAISILCALSVLNFLCKKSDKNLDFDIFCDFIPIIVLVGILSARLYYVILNFEYYSKHLLEACMIWQGGLSIHGAILGGILVLFIWAKLKKINFAKYLDALCVVLPLAQSIGRWGNFFNQEAFGKPCNYFWCMYIQPQFRPLVYLNFDTFHPAFLYESILDLLIFFVLLFLFLKCRNLKLGLITTFYLILYSMVRIFVEFIRIDANVLYFGIPFPIVVSCFILLISLFVLFYIHQNNDIKKM